MEKFQVPATPENVALAKAVTSRINAELFAANSKKWSWYALAFSTLFSLLCCAGYLIISAYMSFNKKDDFSVISKAISDALGATTFRADTTGKITLTSEQLQLAPNQTVRLDPQSTVKLEKDATIFVRGEIPVTISSPSSSTNQANTRTSVSAHTAYFTVFKSIKYREGSINTGWKYLTANQQKPSEQYCYYTTILGSSGDGQSFHFASNGAVDKGVIAPQGFDVNDAARYCIWYADGSN